MKLFFSVPLSSSLGLPLIFHSLILSIFVCKSTSLFLGTTWFDLNLIAFFPIIVLLSIINSKCPLWWNINWLNEFIFSWQYKIQYVFFVHQSCSYSLHLSLINICFRIIVPSFFNHLFNLFTTFLEKGRKNVIPVHFRVLSLQFAYI